MTTVGACQVCGSNALEGARFCHECGAPLASAVTAAEYKQVTVLFADVVQAIDLAAAVGAERWREIMLDLGDRCAAVVAHCGGTMDKFTGNGMMAVFGAPLALEDHAVRACMAALGLQDAAQQLAVAVRDRDGVDLQLCVGLNSGEVVAGEIGSASFGYTAVGEHVGLAERMESVAPPGAVMLSESTARLVEGAAVLGEPEMVRIKGFADPVPARRLLSMATERRRSSPSATTLVGREWEMATLAAMLNRSMGRRGSVVAVAGAPGIGKTRLAWEAVRLAEAQGAEVFATFCEPHATDVPFRVISKLLRAIARLHGLDDQSARERVQARFPDGDPQDLLLLYDLLGIAEPGVELAKIDPDARRRRLTALINTAQLARTRPAVFVVEDVHWIDQASESMLLDLLAVVPQTPSLVLITYRPEYRGGLREVSGAQALTLAPLSDEETAALVAELLGGDASVREVGAIIAGQAAGNPFFAEEITRELAERGVLVGKRGNYVCRHDVTELRVPATLQAAVAVRIDRLAVAAKHTLAAAAVIGSRFSADLLASLDIEPCVKELVEADLIHQVRFTPRAEYTFRHPLIRTVAYETQLRADRAETHRRLAAAIESRDPQAADQNAALIAQHLEAAGDLHAAYGWHMRAAAWASLRDIAAARVSWERARKIADELPAEDPARTPMRVAPRTMLCATAWRVHERVGGRFEELKEMCAATGDKASLAIAMQGLLMDYLYQARIEASQLASESWALVESIGDPSLTVGLSTAAIHTKLQTAEHSEALRWSQKVIDLADGDPRMGNFVFGCPLALAISTLTVARFSLGRHGWRDDIPVALAMARSTDLLSYPVVVTNIYCGGISAGVLTPDDSAMGHIDDAVHVAERSAEDSASAFAQMALGVALLHRQTAAERCRGRTLLAEVREVLTRRENGLANVPILDVYMARHDARAGNRDEAIPLMRTAVDNLFRLRLLGWGVVASGLLVETLLDRGSEDDIAEAQAAVERLAAAPADEGFVMRDIWLLRMRALLARARGDAAAYAELRDRYRDMAKNLEFDGHIAWAEAMP